MMRGLRDLKVYQLAYKLAMKIFNESKVFPKEGRYSSLTDQIRRSSRSVAPNIAEAFQKRRYPNMFISKLAGSDAEAAEAQVWLDFVCDCGYPSQKRHEELVSGYEEVGRMLGSMMAAPEKFRMQKAEGSKPGRVCLSALCLLFSASGLFLVHLRFFPLHFSGFYQLVNSID